MTERMELVEKVKGYEAEISRLQAKIENMDGDSAFDSIEIVELKAEIRKNERRVLNLKRRLSGQSFPGPTPQQIAGMAYVMSDDYDND